MALNKIDQLLWLLKKPGMLYLVQRVIYTFQKNTGLLALKFPTSTKKYYRFSPIDWKNGKAKFLIETKNDIVITPQPESVSPTTIADIRKGRLRFFNGMTLDIAVDKKWNQHPVTHQLYDTTLHWTKIPDFSKEGGDIKYIWEPARFCYLYDMMRYDHHTGHNNSALVFSEILSWIETNPLNRGPHYMSSQEIGLRVLNWIYALHFYSDAQDLSDETFTRIVNSIYQQTKHIYDDRYFSKKFVRNNHVLTEALCLFTVGLLFPQFKESAKWKTTGYKTFCNEIEYQFAEDGSYLQHAFNYQRVAIQLSTWFISLCQKNSIAINDIVRQRLTTTLEFMHAFINEHDGKLPNFGNNDGSLFFPLNACSFENYKPQLQALAHALGYHCYEKHFEDTYWMNVLNAATTVFKTDTGIARQFTHEGYYVLREQEALTFLWCPALHHRPAQADMLHLDIWYNGQNIMRDCGTYSYHAPAPAGNFFSGSMAHNTLLCDNESVLSKGNRFIYFYWTRKQNAYISEAMENFTIHASMQIRYGKKKYHLVNRQVIKTKGKPEWTITDTMDHKAEETMTQVWNTADLFFETFGITACDEHGKTLTGDIVDSWYAPTYGLLEPAKQIRFQSTGTTIKTTIYRK